MLENLTGRGLTHHGGGAVGGVAAVKGRADDDGSDDENKNNDECAPVGVLGAGVNGRAGLGAHSKRSPLIRLKSNAIISLFRLQRKHYYR